MTIKNFRYVALAEAASFLVLLVATYFKRVEDEPGGVTVMGPIHGLLFVVYVVFAFNLRESAGWSNQTTVLVLLGAVVPFGGIAVDRWLARGEVAQRS